MSNLNDLNNETGLVGGFEVQAYAEKREFSPELEKDNKTLEEIAKECNCSAESLKYYINKQGLIVPLKDLTTSKTTVKKGYLCGSVDGYNNLSQEGNCWIFPHSSVTGSARVSENAVVSDFCRVSGNAVISGNATIRGFVEVCDDANISGNAIVEEHAFVCDKASISGNSKVFGKITICEDAVLTDNALVQGDGFVGRGEKVIGHLASWTTKRNRTNPNSIAFFLGSSDDK